MGLGRGLESLLEKRDVVHRAVQPLGLNGVGTAEQHPGVGGQPAGSLGPPRVGELATRARQDPREAVDDVGCWVFSRHA